MGHPVPIVNGMRQLAASVSLSELLRLGSLLFSLHAHALRHVSKKTTKTKTKTKTTNNENNNKNKVKGIGKSKSQEGKQFKEEISMRCVVVGAFMNGYMSMKEVLMMRRRNVGQRKTGQRW